MYFTGSWVLAFTSLSARRSSFKPLLCFSSSSYNSVKLVSQSKSRIQVLLLFDWMAKFPLLEWMLQELGKTQYFAARSWQLQSDLRMPYDIYTYMAWNEVVTPTIKIAYLVNCSIAPVFCTVTLAWATSAWLLRTCSDQLSRKALFPATGKSGALIWYSLFEWDGVVSISLRLYTVWTRGSWQPFLLPPWNQG